MAESENASAPCKSPQRPSATALAASNSASRGNRSSALSAHSRASSNWPSSISIRTCPVQRLCRVGIEFQHLGVEPQGRFKVAVLKGRLRLGAVIRLVLHQRLLLRPLFFGLPAQFKINESAHARVALVKANLYQPARGKTTHFRNALPKPGDTFVANHQRANSFVLASAETKAAVTNFVGSLAVPANLPWKLLVCRASATLSNETALGVTTVPVNDAAAASQTH